MNLNVYGQSTEQITMSIESEKINLETWLQEAEEFCNKHSIPLIYGRFEEQPLAEIIFNGSHKALDKTQDYFQQLNSPSVSIIALIADVTHLTEEIFQYKLDQAANSDAENGGERLQEIESCRGQIGQVAAIGFAAVVEKPSLILSHDIFANWFGSIFGDAQSESRFHIDREEEDSSENDRIEMLARRVAEDERLEMTRNQGERTRVTKAVLQGEKLERYDAEIIAKQAWEIYRIEIKPKRDEILLPQAEQLEADGHSLGEIAKKLRIPVLIAKRLLGR